MNVSRYMIVFLFLFPLLSQLGTASDDALMGEIEVIAMPDTQGVGGPITIDVGIPFEGGCCYPLYAYDVSATLDVQSEVIIVSGPDPIKYPKVEARAGGEPTFVHIKYVVKSMIPGKYAVKAIVTTKNCGSNEGKCDITVREGCILSIPEIYPDKPQTGRPISVKFDALSPIEGVVITDVTLFYVLSHDTFESPKAKLDKLFVKNGSFEIVGTPIPASPSKDRQFGWDCEIPSQKSACLLYYWFVATDNYGNKTTSPVYTIKIDDLEFANFVVSVSTLIPIIGTIIGCLIILSVVRRKKFGKEDKGVFLLGSENVTSPLGSASDDAYLKKLESRRRIALVVLGVAGVVLLLWAIMFGYLNALVSFASGGGK